MKIGEKAPEILGKDANGREIKLSDYAGRKVILYFYPKDNTSGCTAQACNLRDNYQALHEAGYEVIGVSKDSQASHLRFAEKYNLPFTLIADTDLQLNQTFDVWREKKMCGRVGMGTVRTTFIIDENGYIANIIEKVKTNEHSNQILNNK